MKPSTDELLSLLQKLEYSGTEVFYDKTGPYINECCPWCKGRMKQPHRDGCQVDALLRRSGQ